MVISRKRVAAFVTVLTIAASMSVSASAIGVSYSTGKEEPVEDPGVTLENGVTYFVEDLDKMGDVNLDGIVSASDLSRLNAYVNGKKNLTDEQKKYADVNFDGKINSTDVSALAAHLKGEEPIISGSFSLARNGTGFGIGHSFG